MSMRLADIRKFFRVHKNVVLDLAIIAIVGLISLTWFRGDFLIDTGDFDFPLDRVKSLVKSLYLWNDNVSFGIMDSRIMAGIPYQTFFAISEIIGLSLVTTEKILIYMCFTYAGITMYYLSFTLTKGDNKRLVSLISAVFYMMNMYTLTFIWNFSYGLSYALMYSFLPLVLALYIKGLNEKKGFRYIILICILWLVTFSAVFVSPPFFILIWAIIFSYGIFHLASHWREKLVVKRTIVFTVSVVIAFALLNMYWIIPMSYSASFEYGTAGLESVGLSDLNVFKLNSASLLDALRLTGYWALNEGYKGDPYCPWAKPYSSPLLLLISFIIPVIAFLPLIFRPKDKHRIYFALLALSGLFLVKGQYPPVGGLNVYLFSVVPGLLRVFREPVIKFGIIVVLAYSFLIGTGLSDLYYFLKNVHVVKRLKQSYHTIITQIPVVAIVFLLVGVYAWPFWTGDVIYGGGKISASSRITVPDYYYDARDYLGKQVEDFTILPLPFPNFYIVAYSWYSGGDPSPWLFSKPTILNTRDLGYATSLYMVKLFHENWTINAGKILSLLNVKYLLLHRDTNWEYIKDHPFGWISTSLESYEIALDNQHGIELEKSFGKLDFYRNKYWEPLQIYAASDWALIDGGLDRMVNTVENDSFTLNGSVLFLSEQLTSEQRAFISRLNHYGTKPSVSFEKIDPTKYIAHVSDAKNPFLLVFSESYNKDWLAYVDGEQVLSEQHYVANSYANAWHINKTGTYDIVLEFWPQKLFYIGSAISLTALIVCVLCMSKDKIKTLYNHRARKKSNLSNLTVRNIV